MKTTLIVIVAVIAYIGMGILTWFLGCLYDRLDSGMNNAKDDAEFMIACIFVWVLMFPFILFMLGMYFMNNKVGNLVEKVAEAIEEKRK